MSDDWLDPYGEDPEARERESRRAEREARRRERQGTLGEKVSEQQAGEPAGGAGSEQPAIAVESPAAGRPEVAPRGAGGGTGADPLLVRRVLAAFVLVAVAALLVFGVSKVIGKLGGSDPAPAPVEAAKVQELLIPEGLTRDQIAALAKDAEIKGDYERASKSFKGFEPAKYGAEAPPNLEGFLFPATYELPRKATVDDLISRQLDAFEENIKGVDMSYAESKNLNVYDVLKIASMVEREIQVPEERKLAAAVIYNRLRAGTPLGIDATIRYEDRNYDEPLLESRLNEETPYNTRIVPGLPPTPIANPGLASIEAAANPAKSKAFFFVVKPGTCGHVFVETEDEFLAAEAEYQAALEAEGGSPTDCP